MKNNRTACKKFARAAAFATLSLLLLGGISGCGGEGEGDVLNEWETWRLAVPHFNPRWTPDGEHIVFGSLIVDSAGTNLGSIVRESSDDDRFEINYSPDVSPDGSRVVYTTFRHTTGSLFNRTHNFEIVSSALDGSSYRRLTENAAADTHPVWSPDGTQIAFLSNRDSESRSRFNLYVMRADGKDVRSVAPSIPSSRFPAVWSPDGSRLAFRGSDRIFTVSPDGSEPRSLGEAIGTPAWSPDGQYLAYARLTPDRENRPDYQLALIVTSPDGSEQREIFSAPFSQYARGSNYTYIADITWPPDGSEIRFVAGQFVPEGTDSVREFTGMHVLRTDGSDLRVLAELDPPGHAAWSPDDSRIAVYVEPLAFFPGINSIPFSSTNSTNVRLYSVAKDGSDRGVLVRSGGRFVAENSGWQNAADDIAACSDGRLVPDAGKNPGLVSDCETLMRIRDTLAGTGVLLGWSADRPMETWDEITIRGDPPRVQVLGNALGGPKFKGSIPAEIANLTELDGLGLGGGLTGPIPPELGSLSKLWSLLLDDNDLTGEIPPELGRLSNLKRLDLRWNNLNPNPPKG